MKRFEYWIEFFIRGLCLGVASIILTLSILEWCFGGVLDQTFLDKGIILLLLGLAHGPEKFDSI